MMPTDADGEQPVVGGLSPEIGPETAQEDAFEAFLQTVRGMVHGDQAGDLGASSPHDVASSEYAAPPAVASDAGTDEAATDWLPGTWVTEESPSRRSGRAERRAGKELRRHEQKLLKAERRGARKHRKQAVVVESTMPRADAVQTFAEADVPPAVQRIPAQPLASDVDEPVDAERVADRAEVATSRRARRQQRREEAARGVTAEALGARAELVDSVRPAGSRPARSSRRGRRADRRREAAHADEAAASAGDRAWDDEYVENDLFAGAMSDTGSMPELDSLSGPSASGKASRREQRPRETEQAAAEVPAEVAAVEVAPAVDARPVEPVKLSRRARRRDRRRERALAAQVADVAAQRASATPEPARVEEEILAEYLARVEAPILPRRTPLWMRRTAKITAVTALIAGAAVLPWAAPEVPGLIADAVPGGHAPAASVKDPPVAPSTEAFVGPVGIKEQAGQFVGVRLRAAGWPREVQVPRLHVDSDVIPISGQSGALLPPDDPLELGWWREGRPVGSQYGTSVITGHTVSNGGGALDHLGKLVVGDSFRVRTDDGWITYVVQRTQIYSTKELARDAKALFRRGGPGRLMLITCDDFNGTFYESNAIVVATPVKDDPFVGDGVEIPDGGTGGGV
jgi:LPXTG-site transpeptidase (sortase) family protein